MVDTGKKMMKAVGTVMAVSVLITFVALILYTILSLDVMTSQDIINATALKAAIGLFLAGLWGFFSLAGSVIAIVWVVGYIKDLFDPKTGLGAITQ